MKYNVSYSLQGCNVCHFVNWWLILPPGVWPILIHRHHFGKSAYLLVTQCHTFPDSLTFTHTGKYTLTYNVSAIKISHVTFLNRDKLVLMWEWLHLICQKKLGRQKRFFFLWKNMLTTSCTWFFLPQQYENGECKQNVGSHDKNCVWLPRYKWARLQTRSSYPTLPSIFKSRCEGHLT